MAYFPITAHKGSVTGTFPNWASSTTCTIDPIAVTTEHYEPPPVFKSDRRLRVEERWERRRKGGRR